MTELDLTCQPPALIVKPRKPSSNAALRHIIAVSIARDRWVDEDGQTGTLEELSPILRKLPPSILACDHSAELLAYLNERYRFDPQWQFRITPLERVMYEPHARDTNVLNGTLVNFFGWRKRTATNHTGVNVYHLCIDPITFSNFALRKLPDVTAATCNLDYEDTLLQLMTWARDLREFCLDERIDLKATQGATARQFLRDPRFYPEPRRKVPAATNDRVRASLPGNEYRLDVPDDGTVIYPQCLYIDQSRAHHSHAARITFPHADTIMAYGGFHASEPGPWITDPRRCAEFILGFHGMILGELEYTGRPYHWRPDYLDVGRPIVWYSTDTDILASLRVRCKAIYAAWGSTLEDHGLNAYAEWAIERLGNDPPAWLKTLLLSTYGTLATRARVQTFGYAQSNGGEPTVVRAGRSEFTALMHSTKHALEPITNNVLHRALIEAATRTESLVLANWLSSKGWKTLGIYADALIVKDRPGREPPVYDPWRTKTTLHNVQFLSSNAFISDEMRKVPGGLDRRRQTELSRATFAMDRRRKGRVVELMWGTRHA